MKTMMVDMDEVMCIGGHLNLVNQFLNTNYTIDDLPGYFTEDLIPKNRLEEYYRFFESKNPYDYAVMIKDAKEVLEKLSKKYRIFICTAYYSDVYDMDQSQCLLYKYHWLQEHFPFLSPYQYVFINDKSLLNCDIKIDDRVSNLKGEGKKYLFDSYHNQDITEEELKKNDIIRVSGWKELERLLM